METIVRRFLCQVTGKGSRFSKQKAPQGRFLFEVLNQEKLGLSAGTTAPSISKLVR